MGEVSGCVVDIICSSWLTYMLTYFHDYKGLECTLMCDVLFESQQKLHRNRHQILMAYGVF